MTYDRDELKRLTNYLMGKDHLELRYFAFLALNRFTLFCIGGSFVHASREYFNSLFGRIETLRKQLDKNSDYLLGSSEISRFNKFKLAYSISILQAHISYSSTHNDSSDEYNDLLRDSTLLFEYSPDKKLLGFLKYENG